MTIAFLLALSLPGWGASQPAPWAFREVGVIEGFYGTPWSHQDRLDMIQFMGEMGMTSYYYAPKDDPYYREKWREPYSGQDLGRFRELLAASKRSKVALYFALSPGLTMVYSSPGDFRSLTAKFDAMLALGVQHFALFFDDVPPRLTNEPDRKQFQNVAAAHTFVINKAAEYLASKSADLVVCPTTYTNAWGDRNYLRDLGQGVASKIPMFWTGTDVVAPEFTAAQAREWGELMSRPPLIWDNFPANDFARWRVFLGPWRGRSADLPDVTGGIISNPMNQAHVSMIPLATLAEYARDPQGYDPDKAIGVALERLFGREAANRLRPFIEAYGTYGWETGIFEPLFVPGEAPRIAEIRETVQRLRDSLSTLKGIAFRSNPRLRRIVSELEGIVDGTTRKALELANSPWYRLEDGRLVYQYNLDLIEASPTSTPLQVDGKLDEWVRTSWRDLNNPQGQPTQQAQVALVHDSQNLYVALRTKGQPGTSAGSGAAARGGKRVTVVVDTEASDGNIVAVGDPILRFFVDPARNAEVVACSGSPFMSRLIAGSAGLSFERLLELAAGAAPSPAALGYFQKSAFAALGTDGGFQAELSIPAGGKDHLRLALQVVDPGLGNGGSFSLARRDYPLNPSTYAELVLK
jgi:beta-N-acetylglucosaminidase